MMNCEDDSILRKSALDEFQDPLPQKQCSDRTIYQSRNDYGISSSITGMIEIIDFGLAVCGDGPHYGPIQIPSFRAPEVILDAGWTYSSDIWNLGVMVNYPLQSASSVLVKLTIARPVMEFSAKQSPLRRRHSPKGRIQQSSTYCAHHRVSQPTTSGTSCTRQTYFLVI